MFVLICILLLCVILLLVWFAAARKPVAEKVVRLSANTNSKPFAFPLLNDKNGMPVVRFEIGSPPQVMFAVVDTASSDLIVGLPDCQGCDSRSIYDPAKSTSVSELADRCTRVTFGTQKDSGCWFKDQITLRGHLINNCSELSVEIKSPIIDLVHETVTFLGSHDRQGSDFGLPKSNYNIMGLCNKKDGSNLLMQLCDGKFGIAFGNRPYIILGEVPCSLTPLITVPDPEFYIVNLVSMKVGDSAIPVTNRLIIDSGSNMMFAPKHISDKIKSAFKSSGDSKVIRLNLGSHPHNFEMIIYPESTFFHESKTPNDAIIMGTLLLKGFVLEFDVTKQGIKIGQI
jgi:hypothetical protein